MDALNSSRVYGRYLYYSDTKSPGNGHFEVYGCTGEIRSAKGYLILHHDAPVLLAHALANDKAECLFPAGLLDYVEPADVDQLGEVLLDDLDAPGSDQLRLLTPGAPILERVQKGRRNISLFDAVRFWAYQAARGYASYDDWVRAVEIRTLAENRRFPEPLTERHALSTGYSVAVWTWTTYRSGYGRSWTMEQRRRGGENRARRVRYDNRERDVEIVRRWESGDSLRLIARAVGITEGGVRWVLRRGA